MKNIKINIKPLVNYLQGRKQIKKSKNNKNKKTENNL